MADAALDNIEKISTHAEKVAQYKKLATKLLADKDMPVRPPCWTSPANFVSTS